jgi:fibronectin type 3 domain-containing protein
MESGHRPWYQFGTLLTLVLFRYDFRQSVGGLSPMVRFPSKFLSLMLLVSLVACGGYGNGGNGGGNTAPGVPASLTATAGNNQVSLSWAASSGATSYNVKRATTSGGSYTKVSSPSTTGYTDTSVTNNTTYYYVVSAVNSYGESANSSEKSAKPNPPAPPAPTGLTANPGNAQVSLSWTASSGATSYNVKRSTTNGGGYTTISSPAAASFNDTTVANFTTYYYVVSAVNGNGESANSSQVSAMPITIPAAPTGLTAVAGNAQVSLSWTAVLGASSYKVKRGTTTGGPYSTQVGTPTGTSFNDTTVANGTTYFYIVTAVNAAGESGNSAEKSATPALPAPGVPTGLTATAGDTLVSLSWTAGSNATSYHVKRSTTSGGPYTQVGAPTTTSFNDAGLTDGATYFYVVSGLNASGESANSAQASATPSATAADVTITVTPSSTHAISPWVYGINFFSGSNQPHFTMDRAGGNRWTAYNWENNFSNAGSDFGPYHNDNLISSSTTPAEGVRSFIAADHTAGLASLMTVQLQGFVSADGNGNVSVANPPDMTRFKTVVDKKSTMDATPFTVNPPTTDAFVYMDEFLWTLDQKFSGQNIFGVSPALPTFVELDNEPELWNSTHLEVQGSNPVTSDNYISKTINLTKALKDQFPNATIFGPVHYGFQGIYNWQGDPTISATPNGANWFPDKYLQAISSASTTYGKPLVDVYDFHWYPEVYDPSGTRIISLTGTTLTDTQVQQIVQAPRDLWDPAWHDPNNSNPWVYQELGSSPIRIVPRLQAKINAEFPSMKGIAITEYEGGGWNHIAGTIAEADMLGVFGVQNLFAASLWPPNGTYDYALAGFRAFRGFDGANANFGDTSVQATSSDVSKVAVYASTDSKTAGRVVFVAINRTKNSLVTAINGLTLSGTATIYQMTAATASGQSPVHPLLVGTQAASGTTLKITLPALSVTTVDVH